MGQRTPLYDEHVAAGAKMVDFAGHDMPLSYGSQIEEHHRVRRDAGVFDVSHMTVIDLTGEDAHPFLRHLLANDVAKLTPGRALYSCLLNEQGGVIDDLIVYLVNDTWFRLVTNAATRHKDLDWLTERARAYRVSLIERAELAMLAVQGPRARDKARIALGGQSASALDALKPFHSVRLGDYFIARTGYTGEDGLEIILPATAAVDLWRRLLATGIAPAGLGARDTLRLEAGLALYGQDMDESVTPLESGLEWTVAFEPADRDFIGRAALDAQRTAGIARRLVGLVLEDRGVLRARQWVDCAEGSGEITSGGFAPTLNCSIALARVAARVRPGDRCRVMLRDRSAEARVVKYPFVRHGQSCL